MCALSAHRRTDDASMCMCSTARGVQTSGPTVPWLQGTRRRAPLWKCGPRSRRALRGSRRWNSQGTTAATAVAATPRSKEMAPEKEQHPQQPLRTSALRAMMTPPPLVPRPLHFFHYRRYCQLQRRRRRRRRRRHRCCCCRCRHRWWRGRRPKPRRAMRPRRRRPEGASRRPSARRRPRRAARPQSPPPPSSGPAPRGRRYRRPAQRRSHRSASPLRPPVRWPH